MSWRGQISIDRTLAEFAQDAVRAAAGASSRVTGLQPLSQGGLCTTVLVTLARPARRVVLKVAPPVSPAVDFARTAAAMALARSAGVPVPETLGVGSSGGAGPWQHLLCEHVDGLEWRRLRPQLGEPAVHVAHRQIAAAVLALQSVRLPGFGELDHSGRPAAVDLLASLAQRTELRIGQAADRELFLEVLARRAALFTPAPSVTLSHDDLHHGDVLFRPTGQGWRLAALIDWDKAWAGPAESDLARMSWWDDMTGPGFWEVYRAAVPATERYRERAMVYQLLWCLEYAQNTPRHRADTAALCRALGVPRQAT